MRIADSPYSVVFLDIDGVLNSTAFVPQPVARSSRSRFRQTVARIDPRGVKLLSDLTAPQHVRVVLSSNWRQMLEVGLMERVLRAHGFRGRFVGRTPRPAEQDWDVFERHEGRRPTRFEPYPRGYEIQQWLDQHPQVGSMVILDDDNDMAHLTPYLVQTDLDVGLQAADVDRALGFIAFPPRSAGVVGLQTR